jgi:acyl carrier protein
MAMSRNEIKEKLASVMKMAMPNIEIDEENLGEQSSLVSDVGLTSVGILYIVIAIEEFFSIRFDNVGFGDFKTVGDVVNYIEKKLEE